MSDTPERRDLKRVPRQELGPKRCADCDWPLTPDGGCPRCDEGESDYTGLTPEQIVTRLQDEAADRGDLAANDALQTVLDALGKPLLPRPDDAEAVERMARAMYELEHGAGSWLPQFWYNRYQPYLKAARAALRALCEISK